MRSQSVRVERTILAIGTVGWWWPQPCGRYWFWAGPFRLRLSKPRTTTPNRKRQVNLPLHLSLPLRLRSQVRHRAKIRLQPQRPPNSENSTDIPPIRTNGDLAAKIKTLTGKKR